MAGGQTWLQELKLAEAHMNAGRLADAEAVLREILKTDPNQAEALNALAALASDAGQADVALRFQQRAVAARPTAPLYWSNLSVMHRRAGNLPAAVESAQRAIALRPSFAAAHNHLGVAQAEAGDFAAALRSYDAAISHRPDFADAHSNRGNALRALGRNREAETSYRRALTLRPGEAGILFNLSLTLEEQGKAEEAGAFVDAAITAARRAREHAPGNAEAASVLGMACMAASRLEDAVRAFTDATAEAGQADAWIGLGNALKALGRLDESLLAFERAHTAAPRAGAALLGITQVKTFRSAADPLLPALEASAADASLPSSERLQVHFALSKAYDDLGRADEAFAHMRAGNALKRKAINYDEARALEFFERVKTAFTSDTLAMNVDGVVDATPTFVIGMPRSGTTLVEQIISSHPLAGAAGEISALSDAARLLGAFPEAVRDAPGNELARAGAKYVGKLRTYAPDKARVTDKTPSNFYLIGLIHLALPNARIVHVTRDPVDTCLSCYSKLFTRGQDYSYDLAELGRYYRAYKELMRHWRIVLPQGRMLEVRYEDVVGDIESQAHRLLAHCGLDWDERALSFHKNERAVSTASASQVRQPIYASSVARWRRYEKHLQPLLDALGDLAPLS